MTGTLVILATAYASTTLENDIKSQNTDRFLRYRGVPKCLLPISGRPALSWWYDEARAIYSNIYIVATAHSYKHFERWASGHSFPKENILNSGFSEGAISDISFVHRVKDINDDLSIVPADLLFDNSRGHQLLETLKANGESRVIYHIPEHGDDPRIHRIAVAANSDLLTKEDATDARKLLICPVAFVIRHDRLTQLEPYLRKVHQDAKQVVSGDNTVVSLEKDIFNFYEQEEDVKAIEVDYVTAHGYLNPRVTLKEYLEKWEKLLNSNIPPRSPENYPHHKEEPIVTRSFARVGLMGNPSDGFYGKTMSLLISNFWAEVTLIPNPLSQVEYTTISILPNPVADPHLFSSIESMAVISETDGYDNGDRLLQACCKVFFTHCKKNAIAINTKQGFSVLFETNIPRQVGLAGSSAIISAFWKTLLKFYGVTDKQIPLPLQASLVLSAEQDELGISAGLQDRVIQAYGGLVFMDFGKQQVDQYGYGKYERLNMDNLPPLWLAYVADPKDSGKVHSSVRQRFANGEPAVVEAMRQFAQFTTDAKDALEQRDHKRFAELMSSNFNLRRAVYGDAALGNANLRMIELAKEYNCVAKFPGSGGAIVGMWNGSDASSRSEDLRDLRWALEKEGFVYVEIVPNAGEV
ncbi:hypothetical protein K450DRAFT_228025 [Umbelopsis ramanniana AG]|uniref:GHMP kinase N-terminal domain-containing protein n=1 Tax=Umbelopsis ramanniana AG TaxID=1314678 RepID=A0AAD5EH90_UMBRA|nr:uncharacterized protein K450DRAFT_228025 [Umbelopsis ramanniana AG]KAI8582235.1 hypothetical protein K450DRAFT_228025 [Umbelopsis ramanniana AG]